MDTIYGKPFDLNVEQVLEHWTIANAIREIIANAIDEHKLTASAEPSITKDNSGIWHIRDYGRGITYQHFTQNEDEEKRQKEDLVIGKFGVGLKDALATFDRNNVSVTIRSAEADITTRKVSKHGFSEVKTLHAVFSEPSDPKIVGTDFAITGVSDEDIARAKDFFLQFAGDGVIETTKYGMILRPQDGIGRIYVKGLLVAEEENFLFSYNITNLTAALKKALNRERTNVGRTAYASRVKELLLASTSQEVAEFLVHDLARYQMGSYHDELQWIDVQAHAARILSARGDVVFATSDEMNSKSKLIDYARVDGKDIVVVPETLRSKLREVNDIDGRPIMDVNEFHHHWEKQFAFKYVEPNDLDPEEKAVFDKTPAILALFGKHQLRAKAVLISETMRLDPQGFECAGLWRQSDLSIVIKRNQLRDLGSYAGTLLHELVHAETGTDDRTLSFEVELTHALGKAAAAAVGPST